MGAKKRRVGADARERGEKNLKRNRKADSTRLAPLHSIERQKPWELVKVSVN
jgi:hypothetical protein